VFDAAMADLAVTIEKAQKSNLDACGLGHSHCMYTEETKRAAVVSKWSGTAPPCDSAIADENDCLAAPMDMAKKKRGKAEESDHATVRHVAGLALLGLRCGKRGAEMVLPLKH
jgi:adenine-specific DNA glycosylase